VYLKTDGGKGGCAVKKFFNFFKYGQKGFTLIELLVVISILGVLAAVVVLNITRYIGAGEEQASATELANVQTAVSAYMYDHTESVYSGPSSIGPSASGALSPYFLGNPGRSYNIDTTGKVTAAP
jgi:type IV pilus assembly protein PilA